MSDSGAHQHPEYEESAAIDALAAKLPATEESAEIAAVAADLAQLRDDHEALNTWVASLTDRVAALENGGGTTPPPPQPETIWITDFTQDLAGIYTQSNLIGKGRDITTYRLKGSTAADEVAALTTSQTNNYQVIRQGVGVGAKPKSPPQEASVLSDLTVDMSDIPHNANGVQIAYVKNPTVKNVKVLGGRGTGSAPPVETALLSFWHTSEASVGVASGQTLIENVELDGRLNDGTVVGSSVLMLNDAYNVTSHGLKCYYAQHGFGIAVWQCGGTHIHYDPDFRFCRKAINHEQPRPNASFTYIRPNCTEQTGSGGGRPHCTFNGNFVPAAGQAYPKLKIVEPLWDRSFGPFRVGVIVNGTAYLGKPQTCRPQDVEVVIDGVSYTGLQNNTKVVIGQAW